MNSIRCLLGDMNKLYWKVEEMYKTLKTISSNIHMANTASKFDLDIMDYIDRILTEMGNSCRCGEGTEREVPHPSPRGNGGLSPASEERLEELKLDTRQ